MSGFLGYNEYTIGTDYRGNSIVDGLKQGGHGDLSSYDARERLAEMNGINNYRGTPQQNTEMLNKLKEGRLRVGYEVYGGYSNY